MHVVCAMFSRGLGGLEQSLVDYCDALISQGHEVTAIIYPGAMIEDKIRSESYNMSLRLETLRNFGQWDIIAKQRLRQKLKAIKPDAVITFGNRALSLAKYAAKGIAPVIARTPNYSVKKMIGVEGIFHTTQHLKDHIAALGQNKESMFHIPNMVKLPDEHNFKFRPFGNPPVIGTMGRFVKKKGFAEFIEALHKLDKMDVDYRAVIGGIGEEDKNLRTLVKKYGLQDKVKFLGWVEDKHEFFESIDIFCLPSLLEPFGIVLLEAFLHGKPTVTTNAEGPREIAINGHDAFVVPKGNSMAMADALRELIYDEPRAEAIAINALKTIKKRYDTKVVSKKMDQALKQIVAQS